jgi:hypothetical protein
MMSEVGMMMMMIMMMAIITLPGLLHVQEGISQLQHDLQ